MTGSWRYTGAVLIVLFTAVCWAQGSNSTVACRFSRPTCRQRWTSRKDGRHSLQWREKNGNMTLNMKGANITDSGLLVSEVQNRSAQGTSCLLGFRYLLGSKARAKLSVYVDMLRDDSDRQCLWATNQSTGHYYMKVANISVPCSDGKYQILFEGVKIEEDPRDKKLGRKSKRRKHPANHEIRIPRVTYNCDENTPSTTARSSTGGWSSSTILTTSGTHPSSTTGPSLPQTTVIAAILTILVSVTIAVVVVVVLLLLRRCRRDNDPPMETARLLRAPRRSSWPSRDRPTMHQEDAVRFLLDQENVAVQFEPRLKGDNLRPAEGRTLQHQRSYPTGATHSKTANENAALLSNDSTYNHLMFGNSRLVLSDTVTDLYDRLKSVPDPGSSGPEGPPEDDNLPVDNSHGACLYVNVGDVKSLMTSEAADDVHNMSDISGDSSSCGDAENEEHLHNTLYDRLDDADNMYVNTSDLVRDAGRE